MNSVFKRLRDEKGVTLIELLTATIVLFLFIIPVSGFYLSGITIFQQTVSQTNLRNELDFVIGDIMQKVQYASYFELQTSNNAERDMLVNLFQSDKLANLIEPGTEQHFFTEVSTYQIAVTFDAENRKPISTVTKDTLSFEDVNYNRDSYLVSGLYHLNEATQILSLYLIIAPKSDLPRYINQKQASFRNLEELSSYIHDEKNSAPFEYIRAITTQFSVSNSQ